MLKDIKDDLLIKFDQYVRFPLRVRYTRLKNKYKYLPEIITYSFMFICLIIIAYWYYKLKSAYNK